MNDPIIKKQHGGARPGAGRHTADGAKGLKNYQIMLTPEHYLKAYKLGDGNVSLGVRRALGQAAMKNRPENQSAQENPILPPASPILTPR